MLKRNLKIVRTHYPFTGTCEACEKRFMSRHEDFEQADRELRAAFDRHICEREEGKKTEQ
jgi:hypothetical protein